MPQPHKATRQGGDLNFIDERHCYIDVPTPAGSSIRIPFKALPVFSDSKTVVYNDEKVIGRSVPVKTFSHGENRTIGVKIKFFILTDDDKLIVPSQVRALQSCSYPRESAAAPYEPPAICQLKCGTLFASGPLCVVLKSYTMNYPDDVAWVEDINFPCKFEMETSWDVVYISTSLPGQSKILTDI